MKDIITENASRHTEAEKTFNPITGEGSVLPRRKVNIEEFPELWLPESMLSVPLVAGIVEAGSVGRFVRQNVGTATDEDVNNAARMFLRVRCKHDFPFWAAAYVYIKNKGGGDDVRFFLNAPQRKLVELFESMRLAGEPIRVILLKARQWGGSTCTQMYMSWLQLIHRTGLNSLIVAHVKDTAAGIREMFDKMISAYPVAMLHELGDVYDANEQKMAGVGNAINTKRVPQRNCNIKVSSAETPDAARGGDYSLVHCSEVALWKTTDGKTPEAIVRSACSGVLLRPYTMIVYESTANGTGNFFQREYDAAKRGISQFHPMFVPWFQIEQYAAPVADVESFARMLWENRENTDAHSEREESGKYLWWLWNQGATLEAINWYMQERKKYTDHGDMASEYPSDDVEAFVHSGTRVFDRYRVEALRDGCRPPKMVGDIYANEDSGEGALEGLRFKEDKQGQLWVWSLPEVDDDEEVTERYLTIVDIGGRSSKADWSVILVIDRLYMADGEKPVVAAQWYGHIDMDLLAWKAVQIAAYYDYSLLVIESNTLETHDKERQVDGDQSQYILNQISEVYPNLYARKQSEDDVKKGLPRKYGFHTNVSTKPMIISTLVKVIRDNLYVERDSRCVDEYITYERKKNGAFGAIVGKHDDLLMTRAIGLHICFREMGVPQIVPRRQRTYTVRPAVSAATI